MKNSIRTYLLLLIATNAFVQVSLSGADTTGDRLNIGANHVLYGSGSTIAGGANNTNYDHYGAILGGLKNLIATNNTNSAILGGRQNLILQNSYGSVICAGELNEIGTNSWNTSIGGGLGNVIEDWCAAAWIGAGSGNYIEEHSPYAIICGGGGNLIRDWSQYSFIGGGWSNIIGSTLSNITAAVIGGGWRNIIDTSNFVSTIAGGFLNLVASNCNFSFIGAGNQNGFRAGSQVGVIAGGQFNTNGASLAGTIGGGAGNLTAGDYGTTGGGFYSTNRALCGTIGGGANNSVDGSYGTVPGGYYSSATGDISFAAGRQAKANHSGAFVWGDNTATDLPSTNANSVTMRASGGYRLFSDSSAINGAYLGAGSGSWTSCSDREAKKNIRPVNARAVLDKVTALPLSTWNYKTQPDAIRHIGPMAQDFKAAFGVGESETGITTIDADGVALAAIQGLHDLVKEKDAAIRELAARLQALEEIIRKQQAH